MSGNSINFDNKKSKKFLLYLVSHLGFFDNKLNQYSDSFLYITKKFITKKTYKTPFLSAKLEPFIMLIASFLLTYQK